MAQPMQRALSAKRLDPWLVATGVAVMAAGCIFPPDLPAEVELASAPYLDPDATAPSQRVVPVVRAEPGRGTSVTFSVEALDLNRHDRLYFALLNDQRRLNLSGSVPVASEERTAEGEPLFRYIITIDDFDLCEGVPEGGLETFTLYVADAEFRLISALDPDPPDLIEEGFIVSRSWTFEYAVDACS